MSLSQGFSKLYWVFKIKLFLFCNCLNNWHWGLINLFRRSLILFALLPFLITFSTPSTRTPPASPLPTRAISGRGGTTPRFLLFLLFLGPPRWRTLISDCGRRRHHVVRISAILPELARTGILHHMAWAFRLSTLATTLLTIQMSVNG